MNILVLNAADQIDCSLEAIISALEEKKYSCMLNVDSNCTQVVAKRTYANKSNFCIMGKHLQIKVSPENFLTRKVKNFIISKKILVDPAPGPLFSFYYDGNYAEVQEITDIIVKSFEDKGFSCHISQ